ncbi:MAG TPA: cobyrinate a,c-diamide synthase [Anaerovoracaceae bacterium]|nr:cobyrinate a,c-diamide synthase [Anaerovoracaceae bacterium]
MGPDIGMEQKNIPRIMIAAASSGSGKTTVTCGLLQAFLNRGLRLASFKCGPDYIDPMFHTEVLGVKSRNLDLFFTDENTAKYLLVKNAGTAGLTGEAGNAGAAGLAVMEGVMGYYDGLAGKSTDCSSYDLVRKTQTPVILIADCKGVSVSAAALIKGFLELRQDHGIKGVILNRISPAIYDEIKSFIEKELSIEVLGYLPEMADCRLESRHLGLVTAREIGNLREIISKLAVQMEATVDLDRILAVAEEATAIGFQIAGEVKKVKEYASEEKPAEPPVKIAVAMDKAFCFYYQDNLDLLEELGAEIVPFSPLEDEELPVRICGLILGGGYPELYLKRLSENKAMLKSIKDVIDRGIPCIAECGGFMYLHQWVRDREGKRYEMAGVIPGESVPMRKLTRFGYITLTALEDNLLCRKGTILKGHEFHYWDSTNTGSGFHAQKPLRETGWDCIITKGNLWAGYPHIHFYSNIEAAAEFIREVRNYQEIMRG